MIDPQMMGIQKIRYFSSSQSAALRKPALIRRAFFALFTGTIPNTDLSLQVTGIGAN